MTEVFTGSFTQQEPICDEGIAAAVEVMRHGRLHRYNTVAGEISHTALLEEEFAAFTGAKYALAVASGGYAIGAALRAAGVQHGDRVLTNAFTLAPVPGAIASVGGIPDLVEVTEGLVVDLDHLEAKAATGQSKYLLLSHMRGHICDMDRLMAICNAHGIIVIEDCAHTMGATFKGIQSGRHGLIGCYSTQTYKHMNSGEGGFLVTDDAETMARAIILSGSYMLYERHRAAPPPEVFERVKYVTPNISGRMDNLRAAILRPQLVHLQSNIEAWNLRYKTVEDIVGRSPHATMIERKGQFVGSSIQFRVKDASPDWAEGFLSRLAERGVVVSWFGGAEPQGFTSSEKQWRYLGRQSAPQAGEILSTLFDMRLPLSFSVDDCALIADIIVDELTAPAESKVPGGKR